MFRHRAPYHCDTKSLGHWGYSSEFPQQIQTEKTNLCITIILWITSDLEYLIAYSPEVRPPTRTAPAGGKAGTVQNSALGGWAEPIQ